MNNLLTLLSGHDFGEYMTITLFILGILIWIATLVATKINKKLDEKLNIIDFKTYTSAHKEYHADFGNSITREINKIEQKFDNFESKLISNSEIIHRLAGEMTTMIKAIESKLL